MIDHEELQELIPFVVLGGLGGAVRSLNEHETMRTVLTRIVTGSFFATLAGLLSATTGLPNTLQYAISGAIGCCATEIMRALQTNLPEIITKKIEKTTDTH